MISYFWNVLVATWLGIGAGLWTVWFCWLLGMQRWEYPWFISLGFSMWFTLRELENPQEEET